MKLVFFGSGSFAAPTLAKLAPHISLVVTQPDKPAGRGMRPTPSAIKRLAATQGVPLETPVSCKDPAFVERIRSERADALVVAAYGQILPMALLAAAARGGINVHASLLPRYRGAAPIRWALLNGDPETGVTLMQMDRGMDTGDVIASRRTPIGSHETHSELESRLAALGADLAEEWMPRIVAGEYLRVPQDGARATYAPKVTRADAELRWDGAAFQEYNRYLAFTDSPGAWLRTRFGALKVIRCFVCEGVAEPGTVLVTRHALRVALRNGALELDTVQPEGKKQMSGRDLANGWRLQVGMSLKNE